MIIFNQRPKDERDKVANLQTSLGTVYTQLISVREMLAEREAQINQLKNTATVPARVDHTLTVLEVLFKLYRLLFLPRES